MKIDITLKITPEIAAKGNEKKELAGHLGTHFDVMDKVFPLDYTERKAIVFDVSHITDRDIEIADIEAEKFFENAFVAFYTGYSDREEYGTQKYFKEHPQLSYELIDMLVEKKISIIGLDFAGVRRGKEHTPTDQRCADKGVFIVENLCNMKSLIGESGEMTAHTYPMSFTDVTGLPCRVIIEC